MRVTNYSHSNSLLNLHTISDKNEPTIIQDTQEVIPATTEDVIPDTKTIEEVPQQEEGIIAHYFCFYSLHNWKKCIYHTVISILLFC